MITEKQIEANRENAKLGGVKTEAGKAIVRMNAVTHGLLIKEVLKKGEPAKILKQLQCNLMEEKAPVGEIETMLVDRIASCIWRLRRVLRVETTKLSDDFANLATYYEAGVITWQSLSRYETMIERQLYKAIHELERQQSKRRGENIPLPLAIDVDHLFQQP